MSASFNKEDKNWLLNILPEDSPLDDFEKSIIFTTFDAESTIDEQHIEAKLKEKKFLKRVCLVKVLLFLPEYILYTLFFDKQYRQGKFELVTLYWKFLVNKTSFTDFRNNLNVLLKTGKII